MPKRPVHYALLGLLAVALWHLLVIAGHSWNPTSLFFAGDKYPPPPHLATQVYQYPNTPGFDGQFYLYIAHDPWNHQDYARYVDNPAMRYRRILFPALAWTLSFGQPTWPTYSYIVVMWLAASLGVYLLADLCLVWGLPTALGMAFLLIPATIVSFDRMMTDVGIPLALVALLWAVERKQSTCAFVALMLVPLARETGLALVGAWVLWQAFRRQWRAAAMGAVAAVPTVLWAVWVHQHFGSDQVAWWGWPFEGILTRLSTYFLYPAPHLGFQVALFLEYLGALGILIAFVWVIWLHARGERSLALLFGLLYTIGISLFAKEDMWGEAYSYVRTGGPTAVALALWGLQHRRWSTTIPMLLALPRIGLQLAWVFINALQHLLE